MTFVVLAVIGAAAIAGLWYVAPMPENGKAAIRSSGKATIGGPFELVDQTGRMVTDKTFAGKYELIYFGYTYCPDSCPTELQAMSRALELIGVDAKVIQPIFITVDPARDTVKEMADYVSHFDPSLIGLTGTPAQIASVAKAYKVYYQKVSNPEGDYVINHSSFIYLMGPAGAFVDSFPPGTAPGDMARHIKTDIEGVAA